MLLLLHFKILKPVLHGSNLSQLFVIWYFNLNISWGSLRQDLIVLQAVLFFWYFLTLAWYIFCGNFYFWSLNLDINGLRRRSFFLFFNYEIVLDRGVTALNYFWFRLRRDLFWPLKGIVVMLYLGDIAWPLHLFVLNGRVRLL